jgi:hypothetical protein
MPLVFLIHILLLFAMVLFQNLRFFNVLLLILNQLLLEFLLVLFHVFHPILEISVFPLLGRLAILLNGDVGLFLFILE